MTTYQDFLTTKLKKVKPSGFTPDSLPEYLFDYQSFIVRMALIKGKFAIFANTGLGKTAMQLAWADAVFQYTKRPVLIVAPLAVAKQTANDEAQKFGVTVQYCTSQDDVINGINITNYEKLGKFNSDSFVGVVLDESSILKSFTGSIRNQLIELFIDTPYKLACSATPSPNDHMELGNHAEFLGIMSRTEMLAQYFVHDSSDTSKWRIKGHASNPFWKWLSEWSIMIQKPSDLGFSDDAYQLPLLIETDIFIETEIKREGELFALQATGLSEQRVIKKQTIELRCQAIADLVNNSDEQWLVWCETNDESALLKSLIPDAVEVKGSDKDSHKEQSAHDFAHGTIRVLVSKAAIYGFGMNWQNCHNIAFASLSNSFEMTYQAIRRCYRFGQVHPVNVYYAVTDTCGSIKANIERKSAQFQEMFSQLVKHMGDQVMTATTAQKNQYTEDVAKGNNFELYLGDCVEQVSNLADDSVDFSVFSPPFSSLYTYSNSERDMGNCGNDDEFYQHFTYLIEHLFRVIKPGCLVSFHCQNIPAQIGRHGYYGRKDFRGDLIRLFEKQGFIFYSEVTIWKDPVVQMQRTKALGLLHKQVKKDSSKSHQGHADYLVTMRKPGERLEPVAGTFTEYYGTDDFRSDSDEHHSINIWQRYASPVWMDIDQSDVLQYREARHSDDERHICPLQLTVIRRALQLWSNPGDVVLSPFAGIGSEGYVSLDMGRKFIGVELKESYYEVAKKNLQYIENKPKQGSLFDVV
jgi:DNA modification methylase